MERYTAETYGERMAGVYDEHVARTRGDEEAAAAAEFLAALAPDGRMLELGIGTGRIAIPLVHRGVEVHGVDASESMVARLHEKPGGADIPVTMGDMADVAAPADGYDVVFVVFNTFFAMLTQRDQVRAFTNVAKALRPGGKFVIEAFVPDLSRFTGGKHSEVMSIGVDEVYFDVSVWDPLQQRVDASHIHLRTGQPVEMQPVSLRFAWPSELDLMGELAGLELQARHADWSGAPFTKDSNAHVSVWTKPR
jgi:SAM-dependent methyltransferase